MSDETSAASSPEDASLPDDDGVEPADSGRPSWGETQFVPGSNVGLVGRLTVALIESGHPSTRDRLWNLVATDAPIDDLLDELSSTGLKGLPSLAVAQQDGDDIRVVARGDARVTVTFLDGSSASVDPSGVRTWREDVFTEVCRLMVTFEGIEDASRADRFFVLAGSVPASSLERSFDTPSPLASVAESEWVTASVPAPALQQQRNADPQDGRQSETPLDDDQEFHARPESDSLVEPTEGDDAIDPAPPADLGHRPEPVPEPATESESEVVAKDSDDPSATPDDSNETISVLNWDQQEPVQGAPLRAGDTSDEESDRSDPSDSRDGAGDDYDFIYGHTVARSVEGAAVRLDEAADDGGRLISSVPGDAGSSSGPTISPAATAIAQAGDHDGMTISRADLAAMKAPLGGVAPTVGPADVLAVRCPSGHPNAPHASNCRICGCAIGTSTPVSVPRPALGVLVFSNGDRIVADRNVLIGRNPRVSGTLTGELPRIVKLESAGQGLSRTHAEVRVEGWQMLLEDLQSTNGTMVTLPGQAPRRLHAGDPVALVAGSTVDFGEELQCRVEVVS